MRLPALLTRALSTRNRRAVMVLLLIVVPWELTEFLIVGHSERWRVWTAWSITIGGLLLALLVLIVGPYLGSKWPSDARD